MTKQRRFAVILIFLGIISLMPFSSGAHHDSYRPIDLIQLLATGVCFGVGFTLLLARKGTPPGD